MSNVVYWEECVKVALDEAGACGVLTPVQITIMAESLVMAAEMEGEATGLVNIPNPLYAEIDRIRSQHAEELRDAERREKVLIGNIARRYHVNPQHVGVSHNGEITYSDGRTSILD